MSVSAGLSFFVPPFKCVGVGDLFKGPLPPTLVGQLPYLTRRNPRAAAPEAFPALELRFQEAFRSFNADSSTGYHKDGGTIIRSAGPYEDGERLSFAGVYDSKRLANPSDIDEFVNTAVGVVFSPYNPRGLRYHHWNNIPIQPIDVIVQRCVPNAVALNFTVTSKGITSVLISSNTLRPTVYNPTAENDKGAFINPRTGLPANKIPCADTVKRIVQRVATTFCPLAKDDRPISIECAFDVNEGEDALALLQLRPLPVPIPTSLGQLTQFTELPIHTHLIPGPCTFDSIVFVERVGIISRELGVELTAVTNRLREQSLTRPLLVVSAEVTEAGTTRFSRLYKLTQVASALPFVGVIDEGQHLNYKDISRQEVLAGHCEALITERCEIMANVHRFCHWFQRSGIRLTQESANITLTELEQDLCVDLANLESDDLCFGFENNPEEAPVTNLQPASPRKINRRATAVFVPEKPVTIEVVNVASGNFAGSIEISGRNMHLRMAW